MNDDRTPGRNPDEIHVQRVKQDDRSSAEIRSDIDRTRSELDSTVEAIEKKLTPGQILGEAWMVVRNRTRSSSSEDEGPGLAKRLVKEHPFPSALVALGLGWMAVETVSGSSEDSDGYEREYAQRGPGRQTRGRRYSAGARGFRPGSRGFGDEPGQARGEYPGRYESYQAAAGDHQNEHEEEEGMMGKMKDKARDAKEWASEKKDQVSGKASEMSDRASERGSGMKERASGMKERVSGKTHEAGEEMSHWADEAGERAHQAREKAGELGHTVQRQARRARRGLRQTAEESPLSLGIATFAAGLLGGMSLPTTRWEDETMGEARDQLMHQAAETGKETAREAKHVAVAAAEGAVHKMEEEGLTASGLAESAREVAREAKESGREEAEKEGLTGEGMKERMSGGSKGGQGRETPGSGGEGRSGSSGGGSGGPGRSGGSGGSGGSSGSSGSGGGPSGGSSGGSGGGPSGGSSRGGGSSR